MSKSILDPLDWKILLEYDRDPFQSFNAISKVVNVHHSTVSDHIQSMKERHILRQDIEKTDIRLNRETGKYYTVNRTQTEVRGTHNPSSVGLHRVHVLFKRLRSTDDFDRLYKFNDAHPYTRYQTRLYGTGVSLYAQYDIPAKTETLLIDSLHQLGQELVEFDELITYKDIYETKTELGFEEQIEQSDLPASKLNITSLWDQFQNEIGKYRLTKPKQSTSFDNLDAELIRELELNGKVNISALSDYYNRDKSTLSRRVSKIRQHIITSGRLLFGEMASKVHGYNNTQIITGKLMDNHPLDEAALLKFINSGAIPIDAYATVDKNNFLMYTRATIGIAGDLMRFLYRNTDPYYLEQYQFFLPESISYPYWYANYDEDEGYRKSINFFFDDPIKEIS